MTITTFNSSCINVIELIINYLKHHDKYNLNTLE